MAQVNESPKEEEALQEVRELVAKASSILRSMDAEKARVGWLLEESLVYLDEPDSDAEVLAGIDFTVLPPEESPKPLLNTHTEVVSRKMENEG